MTLAELNRALNSRRRQIENEERRKASFDYILADLIGKSVGRLYSSSNKMPELSEVYPSLFNSEELQAQKQAKKMELSALRFRHFTDNFNKRFVGGANKTDE